MVLGGCETVSVESDLLNRAPSLLPISASKTCRSEFESGFQLETLLIPTPPHRGKDNRYLFSSGIRIDLLATCRIGFCQHQRHTRIEDDKSQ